jgi:hypothetical protein
VLKKDETIELNRCGNGGDGGVGGWSRLGEMEETVETYVALVDSAKEFHALFRVANTLLLVRKLCFVYMYVSWLLEPSTCEKILVIILTYSGGSSNVLPSTTRSDFRYSRVHKAPH